MFIFFFFFKQKTAYEMRISDWSSDVCSSDLASPTRQATLSRECRSLSGREKVVIKRLAVKNMKGESIVQCSLIQHFRPGSDFDGQCNQVICIFQLAQFFRAWLGERVIEGLKFLRVIMEIGFRNTRTVKVNNLLGSVLLRLAKEKC